MKTKFATGYSEANAGSGEIAVVQLVRRIESAPVYSLVLLDEPEISLHPGAQENLKNYLLEAIKERKLQVVVSTHSLSIIRDLPNSAIKLFRTNENGRFYVKENVYFEEAFYDIEYKVSDKKMILCEDFAAQTLIKSVLKHMKKEQYFDVIYYHGGAKNLVNHHMTSIAINANLSKKIYIILDGDMKTEYIFKEDELTKKQSEDSKYLAECVKKAFGMELDVYPDGGKGGTREDQKCEEYLKYLRYYNSNVFFLPQRRTPEEIILKSQFVNKSYREIIKENNPINSRNAKKVIEEISKYNYGDAEHMNINSAILLLTNRWMHEENLDKKELINILNFIFAN